ncbi:CgeB family protein [Geomesophilobacter sediminis]|uniref:Glycosyltransferase family 1 protein n=1 Tax=Geomesophilobacter sediminis TaxID=2798584 RepID=A0A8J7J626_9BACT|nr:glycosyltransferase [Geomesophilobacter sediminis]MBJ6724076.1 glycosyltransferase family 1 protein [Geomesophilobacter sediminis]
MKLLKITSFYPSYLSEFYAQRPGLAEKSFVEQKEALDFDAFGWSDYWSNALEPLGYQVMEVTINAAPLQRAWGRENGGPAGGRMDLKQIAVAQAKDFQPDILWFDDPDVDLLLRIREECPSIRLVLGWSGSPIAHTDVWRRTHLILSCAPEAVNYFRGLGLNAAHLDHGFDPRINSRLAGRTKRFDFSFIGQLVRSSTFHLHRDRMLEDLAHTVPISIFSPSASLGLLDDVKALLMAGVYDVVRLLQRSGIPEAALMRVPLAGRVARWPYRPARPVNRALKPFLRPAVFGLSMFQVIRDSRMVLNIHADSSPLFASNMRLFETTGTGSCLVTDWKPNLPELFEPDREVVVYKSTEECREKVTWLLEHPAEMESIAKAGQKRTLENHGFSHRAPLLDNIIKGAL